jgi:hypothetical protein
MFDKNVLLSRLTLVGNAHEEMVNKFAEFSKQIKSELTASDFPLKGIQFESSPNPNIFSIIFAGKKILFSLSISISDDDIALGRVSCFMEGLLPEEKLEKIGIFSFSIDGEAIEDDNKKYKLLYSDSPTKADVLALHFLNIALSRC